MPDKKTTDPDLVWLDRLATLMDNQFPIPFTKMRFGLDSLVGLIPVVGDSVGLVVSGYLMTMIARKGGSVWLIFKMMGNVLIDATVGIIPVLGDFFDFGFKANRRNVDLLKKYYAAVPPEKRTSGRFSLAVIGFLAFVLVGLAFVGIWKMAAWAWSSAAGLF